MLKALTARVIAQPRKLPETGSKRTRHRLYVECSDVEDAARCFGIVTGASASRSGPRCSSAFLEEGELDDKRVKLNEQFAVKECVWVCDGTDDDDV